MKDIKLTTKAKSILAMAEFQDLIDLTDFRSMTATQQAAVLNAIGIDPRQLALATYDLWVTEVGAEAWVSSQVERMIRMIDLPWYLTPFKAAIAAAIRRLADVPAVFFWLRAQLVRILYNKSTVRTPLTRFEGGFDWGS